jgi:hypothetical protein
LSDQERQLIDRYRLSNTETREQVQRVAEALMPFKTQKRENAA